jgi:APA family basic amino acid/polyamine antiporter
MREGKLLGKWMSTSLVLGNMVGAGVFMMPAVLGSYGGISIAGWIFSSLGAILIAILFSRLGKLLPGVQGGPYAFTRAGLGEFPGFIVAWGYWISVWTTNAALAVAFSSYLSVLMPFLELEIYYSIAAALMVLWGLTWFNTLGIRQVGKMSLITTILKLTPIILIGIIGLYFFEINHFVPLNISEESSWKAIAATTTFTFFAYLGIESATIPAESVKDPGRIVPFATKWGTIIAMVVYLLSSISIMGLIHPSELSDSSAPFADAAMVLWGEGAQYLVAIAALISVFGALNGWILMQGQMPEAIARDRLFPSVFARENKNGIPALGIYISSVLASLLIVMNYSGGLLKVFEFMILVSTVCVLIPYLFCSVSYIVLLKNNSYSQNKKNILVLLACSTFLFSAYALIGSGWESILWGFVFLLFGIPVYFLLQQKKSN